MLTERSSLLAKSQQRRVLHLGTAQLARLVTFASSFSEGWEIAIFSLVLVPVSEEFGLTSLQIGLLASLPLLFAVIGYLFMGWCMDAFGRKPTIIATYVICAMGCLCMASASGMISLGIGRCFMVLGVKSGVTCVSVYMTELSPSESRGALVSLEEIYINLGILSATFTAWMLMGMNLVTWRMYVALGACAPALALTCLLLLQVPESPRYLQLRGREAEALTVLRSALDDEREILQTLDLWRQEAASQKTQRRTLAEDLQMIGNLFSHKGFRIATACWLARAGGGLTIIATYTPLFLNDMGKEATLRWFTIGQVAKTLALIPSVVWLIDRCGRCHLFLASAVACCLSMAAAVAFKVIGVSTVAVACCIVMYLMSFSIGYGPVVWVYCFEILPGDQRGKAAVISMVPGDAFGFLMLTMGPMLLELHAPLPFMVVAVTNACAAMFFLVACPETKGLLLEQAKDAGS